jgi:hypothetical protein
MKSISDRVEAALSQLNDSTYLVNPYMRIPKENKENLRKYKIAFKTRTTAIYLIVLFAIYPLVLLTFFLKILIRSVFFILTKKKIEVETQEYFDNLVLTHFVRNNQFTKNSDPFFGGLISNLEQLNFKNICLYTNQMRKQPSRKLMKELSNESIFLIPKLIPREYYLDYIVEVFRKSIELLKVSTQGKLNKDSNAFFYLIAAVKMLNRETYVTYNLARSLIIYVQKYKIKNVFLTFEGHSFEQLVIEMLKPHNVNVYLVQHSPITENQKGVNHLLASANQHINICVTGEIFVDYFIKHLKFNGNVFKTGTHKYRNSTKSDMDKSKIILFAPEGKLTNLVSYIRFVIKLEKELIDYRIKIRIHPNLRVPFYIKLFLEIYESRDIFKISNQSLESDLKEAEFVVYRSSAVGIESLFYFCVPIYLLEKDNYGGDALLNYQGTKFCCSSTADVVEALHQNKYDKNHDVSLGRIYFEKANYAQLNNSLYGNLKSLS